MAEKRLTDAERLQRIKDGLKCSDEEAAEILAYDKKIDKDEKSKHEHDLNAAQQKVASQYTRTGTRKAPTVYKFEGKKGGKPDATKESFIEALAEFVTNFGNIQNVAVVNKTREISFDMGDENFSLTLVRHTKKKK